MKTKRSRNTSSEGPAKKKFKKPGNFNKKKTPKKGKNIAKNAAKNATKNTIKNAAKIKEEKENTPKYEKSKIVKNNIPNKTKNAKFSQQGKPNLDLKKLKKGETQDTTGEKPNWLEYKKQQKELKEKRRAKKLNPEVYDIAVEAKKLGEKLRKLKINPDTQEKLTTKFHDLVKTQYAKMIFTHDLSRVIQWQIKYASPDIQLAIVEELKPNLRNMFFSLYAKNIIRTLLKAGSDAVKKHVLQVCYGDVVKMLSSVLSSSLFEKIYVEVANDAEKNTLKQELYGDMYKKSKDPNIKTLTDVYKDSDGMKTATLSAVKTNLTKILNKNLVNSTLVHTVLYEYLTNCSKEDRAEMMSLARPLIKELSQTKDGAKAGNLCIWHGTNKDKKLIMKTLKEHIKDIMTSEHGYLMILALLDCVDDTVLLKKILLQEVLNNLTEIALNEYGRRIILYIVARRDTHHFHPSLIEYLKEGDSNEMSKKPADIREKELLENVIDNLVESVASDVPTWLSNGPIMLVTLAILKAARGDKPKAAFEAIAKFITNPESKLQKEEQTTSVIEDTGLHMILKKLIQIDAKRHENNELTFGEVLLQYLTDETIQHWIELNRGCFLLVMLIENESETVVSELKSKLKKYIKIKPKSSKGALILLKKLE